VDVSAKLLDSDSALDWLSALALLSDFCFFSKAMLDAFFSEFFFETLTDLALLEELLVVLADLLLPQEARSNVVVANKVNMDTFFI
ncbi:hypothetical protein ACKI1O_46885, partial [Streptomyces scabiei]